MLAYQKLTEHYKNISHFSHLASICHWDQATMMPSGGNDARASAMAALSVHLHQLSTDKNLEAFFQNAKSENLNVEETANLLEMKRAFDLATVLPEKHVKEKSLAGSRCEHAWRTQRQNNDWAGFCENFKTVVALSKEEAQIRADASGLSPYDAMLDIYEPGMTCEKLDLLFSDLKAWLPELTQKVQEKQSKEFYLRPNEIYKTTQQNELGLSVMAYLGFDFNHGRLDISTHPFCGGVNTDVRITTRYDEADFVQSLMGIIHETGHARYEQGLPCHFSSLPAGQARSMGMHESQSLFFEMQLGRSQGFIQTLSPLACAHFPHNDPDVFKTENLQKIYTRVQPGLIRVDADEITYPAHIMLRYEIERDLINGKITYKDIPELWDLKMKEYLNMDTQGDFKNGCMQDIHWCDGSFGYFPSYTLGAMYAAQFMATIKKAMDVDDLIRSADLTPVFNWLDTNIWKKGSLLTTDALVMQATGEILNPAYFKKHLIDRYL